MATERKPGCDAVCVDVETTGLDPELDGILAIGTARVAEGRIVDRWSRRVDPGEERAQRIGAEGEKVHGIDAAGAREGVPFAQAWDELVAWLEAGDAQRCWLAHNAEFDRGFIEAERARTGRSARSEHEPLEWVDSWALSREAFGRSGQRHGLDALARRMGLRDRGKEAVHDAGGDAELLARCWVAWGRPEEGDLFAQEKPEEGPLAPVLPAATAPGGTEGWQSRWQAQWERGQEAGAA